MKKSHEEIMRHTELIDIFSEFCYDRHDFDCNQKYGDDLPYSFHLKSVLKQVLKYSWNLTDEEFFIAVMVAVGHDLIEDARITYNELVDKLRKFFKVYCYHGVVFYGSDEATDEYKEKLIYEIANGIYLCSEYRGKTREERLTPEFYRKLAESRVATYVKMSDIMANMKFGISQDSKKVMDYFRDYPHLRGVLLNTNTEEIVGGIFIDYEKLCEYVINSNGYAKHCEDMIRKGEALLAKNEEKTDEVKDFTKEVLENSKSF